jgi:exonuclease SbcC
VLAEHDGCPCASTSGDLEVCRREHDAARADLEAMLATRRRLEALAAECEVLRGEVLAAVRAGGFAGLDEARDASLPAGAVAELRQATSAWQQALAGAQGTLEDPDVGAALSAPAPDVAGQAAARDTARSELLRVSSDDALLRRTLDALARVRAAIEARCSRLAAAHHEHLVLRELADTLGGTGSNALRMRLSAFVLAARLEKVVALANERLGAMGDGRYQLRHTDGLAARGARSGLGLEVLDLWTGHPRDTSSLSGGESFMASLALALGLADAVREESGGFDLQTLFIDEGFGTLDDESLEQVMEVLDGLREGGRAVGVVSHVAELRSRIPSQVIVSKSERGSTVRLAGADSAAPAA